MQTSQRKKSWLRPLLTAIIRDSNSQDKVLAICKMHSPPRISNDAVNNACNVYSYCGGYLCIESSAS